MASLSQPFAGGGRERPTPLNPFPRAKVDAQLREDKAYPPELGAESIAILAGRTFMCSSVLGRVPPRSVGGLLHNDTRFLSRWELTLSGRQVRLQPHIPAEIGAEQDASPARAREAVGHRGRRRQGARQARVITRDARSGGHHET